MSIQINQQQLEQLQAQRQNGLTSSEYLNQNGYNRALTQEQAAKISVFLPSQMAALNYGLQKQEIEQSDYDKAIKGEQMSTDGKAAFAALTERLSANFTKLLEYFSSNKKESEDEDAVNVKEQAAFNRIMADGIVTDEELAEYSEEIEKFEEEQAAEEAEEEAPVEEEPIEEEGKPGREEEVNAAFDAFLSDLTEGREFDVKNHPGISEADYKGIVSDFKDDGVIGNGDRKAQFESDNIAPRCGDLVAKAKAEGKNLSYTWKDKDGVSRTQTLKGIYDNDDSRYTYKDDDTKTKDKDDNKKKPEEE